MATEYGVAIGGEGGGGEAGGEGGDGEGGGGGVPTSAAIDAPAWRLYTIMVQPDDYSCIYLILHAQARCVKTSPRRRA